MNILLEAVEELWLSSWASAWYAEGLRLSHQCLHLRAPDVGDVKDHCLRTRKANTVIG